MKIAFTTLGCKLNYAETSTYERSFKAAGWDVVPWSQEADMYLVNTCAVTETAEKKSRNLIRRAHKTAPDARIVVTGCYAQLRKDQLLAIDGVEPTVANIRNGTYPFITEAYAVTARPREGNTAKMIDFLRSPEGRRMIEASGYAPAPPGAADVVLE